MLKHNVETEDDASEGIQKVVFSFISWTSVCYGQRIVWTGDHGKDLRALRPKYSPFYPYGVFVCIVWVSEQMATAFMYSINWLVFITETEYVYCAVRTESLNVFQLTFRL